MTGKHDSEHQLQLDKFLCGEWEIDRPELQALRDSCALCREEIDSLVRTGQMLDASAIQETETLERGLRAVTGADEAFVQAHMQDLWEADRRRQGRQVWRWSGVAAAAGLIAWLGWSNLVGPGQSDSGAGQPGGDPGQGLQVLNSSAAELLAPIGKLAPGSTFESFRWEVDLAPGETLTLRVWSENAIDPTILVERLRTREWTPSVDQLEAMGTSVEWQLQHLSGGVQIATYEGSAELQP